MVVCPGPYLWYQFFHSNVTVQSLSACRYMEQQRDRLWDAFLASVIRIWLTGVQRQDSFDSAGESQSFASFLIDSTYSWELERNGPRKKTREKLVMLLCVKSSAGICFASSGHRSTYLQVFRKILQLISANWAMQDSRRWMAETILHQSDGRAKKNVAGHCFLFLEETSEFDGQRVQVLTVLMV